MDVDLRKFTGGFAAGATYGLSNVAGGSAVLQADGRTARFTPTAGYVGRARFDFTVNDGQTWTQTCGILVSAAGLPRDLVWRGDGSSNAWDTTSSFWVKADGTFTSFSNGDTALFDDRGAVSPPISLSGSLAPSSVTVDTDVANTPDLPGYTFAGTGAITGATGLVKSGVGTLNVNTANSFTGGTTVNEGTLVMGHAAALSSGAAALATLNGGTLELLTNNTSNKLQVTAPSTVFANGSNLQWTGEIDNDSLLNLKVTTANGANQTFTVAGPMGASTGTFRLGANGTLRLNASANVNFGSPTATFDLGTGSAALTNRIGNLTVDLGALTGGSGTKISGAGSANFPSTYRAGALNADTTFAGAVQNGGGNAALTNLEKVGTGALTLSGSSTYTGATTVTAGSLIVAGSLGNTAVTVASGARLAAGGTLNGPVTASAGALLSPGTAPSTGATMNVGNSLSLNNGVTLLYDLSSSPAGANDRIVLNDPASAGTRTLSLTGQLNFQFLPLEGFLGAGTYDLITGATNLTASNVALTHNLPAGTRQTFTLARAAAGANPPFNVRLTVAGNPAALVWTGASGAVWDSQNTASFSGGTGNDNRFFTNDTVTFDDTAAGGTVTLSGLVQPRVVTVNNPTRNYTFAGTGSLGGNARLEKSGAGTLTIAPALVTVGATTTSGSPTVTVTDATGLAPGMTAGGAGIPAGTTILAVSGTTLTLSQNATASATPTLSLYAAHSYTGGPSSTPAAPSRWRTPPRTPPASAPARSPSTAAP